MKSRGFALIFAFLQRRFFWFLGATVIVLSACGGGAEWYQSYVADVSGRFIYVSPNGNDAGKGSLTAPLRTVQAAVDRVDTGDTVILQDGTYAESVVMTRSGSAFRYVTVRAAHPGLAKIKGPAGSYSAFLILNAGWVRVEGLDVQAADGHGLEADGGSHHIQLVNNVVHDSGGSGISLQAGDYYLVEGNQVYRNASTNPYQTSGISLYQPRAYDQLAGYHIVIQRNVSHSNIESATGRVETSEGNGIILDDFHNSQTDAGTVKGIAYKPNALVENNVVFNNGGAGIAVYESDNVTVRHNTVALNNTDPLNRGTWRGELQNSQGKNNRWYNNIAVAHSGLSRYSNAMVEGVTGTFQNTGTEWEGNFLFDIAAPQREAILIEGPGNRYARSTALVANRLKVDPKLMGGTSFRKTGDLKLHPSSPAAKAGRPSYVNTHDFDKRARNNPTAVGAFESP
jgi:parallel beta-helix repeat protein